MRTLLSAILTLAVTAALVVYAFWDVDLGGLGGLLTGGDYRALAPFLGLLTIYFAFTALRWQLLLEPLGRFRVRDVVPAMMIGFAGNNVLPAHLGEVVRAVVFARRFSCSRAAVLTTQVVERMLDVLGILLLYLVAVLWLPDVPAQVSAGLWIAAVAFAGAGLALVLFLRHPAPILGLWNWLSAPLPARMRQLGRGALESAATGLSALNSPGVLWRVALYSVLKWAAAGGMVWLSLWSYGVSIPPALGLVVVAVAAVAVTLPSVPGFFGVMQAAFVFALTPFEVSREAALAASVFYVLAQWLPVTLLGLAFLLASGIGSRNLREELAGGPGAAG